MSSARRSASMRSCSCWISLTRAVVRAPAPSCRRAICCSILSSSCCAFSPRNPSCRRPRFWRPSALPPSTGETQRRSSPARHWPRVALLRVRLRTPVSGSFHLVNVCIRNCLTTWDPLVNDSHRAAPTQLLDARNKIAVWLHIIAFRFHHHHEIPCAFHVKQHLGLAFAFGK